jgi:death-on-curing protein
MDETAYEFLDFELVCEIHGDLLERYGGQAGIRDENAVHSSIAASQWAAWRGLDAADIAAAYLYHFAVNQAFVDGNKRTAFATCFEFLARNGYLLAADPIEAADVTLRIANKHRQHLVSMP